MYPTRKDQPRSSRMQVKVYLVHQWQNLAREGEPNTRVIASRLTWGAAQDVVDRIPGTFIERHIATK